MGWIIFAIFIVVALLALGQLPRGMKLAPSGEEEAYKTSIRWVGRICSGILILVFAIVTITSSIHSVQKGHIGLVTTFGAITDQRSNGLAVIGPWQGIEQVDVRSQTTCAKGDRPENGECKSSFEPFSKENIDVHLKGAFSYHVDPDDIQFLYTKIGPNYEDKVILPILSEVVRAVVPEYGYATIAENRVKISDAIRDRMKDKLANHPQPGVSAIKADAFALMNFDFNQDVKDAINQKVLENERANQATAALRTAQQQAEANKAQAEGQAKVVEATATGQKNAAITRAEGEAKANELVSSSLTPNLLALRISETQKIQWGLVAPGTSIIGALGDFFKANPAVAPATVSR